MHAPVMITCPQRQQGITLVMVLLVLSLMTVLGLLGINVSSLQERMTHNTQDRGLAFNAAEAGLRMCETTIRVNAAALVFGNAHGLYTVPAPSDPPRWRTVNWDDADATIAAPAPVGVVTPPRCLIEQLPVTLDDGNDSLAAGRPVSAEAQYRITARGVGSRAETVVFLQTVYRR